MGENASLCHAIWECKNHVTVIAKCRKDMRYELPGRKMVEVFHQLANQEEGQTEPRNTMSYHVHMLIAISPKYAASKVIGYIKGKSAIHMARLQEKGAKEIHGVALFGARVLRVLGRAERDEGPDIHPQPGTRRSTTGSGEAWKLIGRRQGGLQHTGAVLATPNSHIERFKP